MDDTATFKNCNNSKRTEICKCEQEPPNFADIQYFWEIIVRTGVTAAES